MATEQKRVTIAHKEVVTSAFRLVPTGTLFISCGTLYIKAGRDSAVAPMSELPTEITFGPQVEVMLVDSIVVHPKYKES